MTQAQVPQSRLKAQNTGGIDETEVEFDPGITILAGRNATNRTSLLRAVMAALGSDSVSPKADADEGHVELQYDGETYTRHLERRNGTVVFEGDPYLDPDEVEVADLFAFLLESNEARRAVERGDDLRELLMRPVDVDAVQAEIDDLLSERNRVDAELENLEDMADRLPGLETERQQIKTQIEEAVAGARFGASDLPDRWLSTLDERDELTRLASSLRTLRSN